MKGIQTVLSFIQMADPKMGFLCVPQNLTDPFQKKYCFVFLQISQPTHRPFTSQRDCAALKHLEHLVTLRFLKIIIPLNTSCCI